MRLVPKPICSMNPAAAPAAAAPVLDFGILEIEDSKRLMQSGLAHTANVAVCRMWQQVGEKMRTSNMNAISYLLLHQLTSNKIAMRFFSRKRIFEIGFWSKFRTCNYSN